MNLPYSTPKARENSPRQTQQLDNLYANERMDIIKEIIMLEKDGLTEDSFSDLFADRTGQVLGQ